MKCALCGHSDTDHDTGPCLYPTHTLWGVDTCTCWRFEVDTDE